jgi:hypothetical protein
LIWNQGQVFFEMGCGAAVLSAMKKKKKVYQISKKLLKMN